MGTRVSRKEEPVKNPNKNLRGAAGKAAAMC